MSDLLVRDYEELIELKLEVIHLSKGHVREKGHLFARCFECKQIQEINDVLARHRVERKKWLAESRERDVQLLKAEVRSESKKNRSQSIEIQDLSKQTWG